MKKKVTIMNGTSIKKLLGLLGPEKMGAMLLDSTRANLDRYVEEISGRKLNERYHEKEDAYVVGALIRWANGDKAWFNDPKKEVAPQKENTHTKETEMKKTTAKKSEKKNGKAKKVETKKVTKAAKKNGKAIGKTTGLTRLSWWRETLTANQKSKKKDATLLEMAAKEFGKEVAASDYSIKNYRTHFNREIKNAKAGFKKSDPLFVSFDK